MNDTVCARLGGAAAGLAGGLFGGGGGMVLLPLLSRGGLPARKLYATSVAVVFPVCLVSAAVSLLRGTVTLSAALPYLCGGLLGGALGARCYGRVSVRVLKTLFALFLLYAAARYLL
ncbi:MAG: sulfite exporter TauE/SafE family protein [Oscillibacter sp.]|nr:sulfite exporter TauE/SafE family protein [Oscillibacter sp.]